jgi:hypothetical protein
MPIIATLVYKETKDVKTGIKVINFNGVNRIHGILPGSRFAQCSPQLVQGMRIVSVNNVQCDGKTSSQVTQLVKDAQGTVILVVDDAPVPQATVATDDYAPLPQDTVATATAVAFGSPPAIAHYSPMNYHWERFKLRLQISLLVVFLQLIFMYS